MRHISWARAIVLSAALVTVAAFVTACKTNDQADSVALSSEPAPPQAAQTTIEHDAQLGEAPWPEEAQATAAISEVIQAGVKKRHQTTGTARRDAHPKAHGCVRARFQVNPTLAAPLAQGVFQPGANYSAWIRFSNGDADPDRADGRGDGRGMAIKLMGVPGPKLMDDESATQDFVMINHPVFFIDNPKKYLDLSMALGSSNPLVQLTAPQALGLEGSVIAAKIVAKKIANPLTTRYWSMVPYQLGTGPGRRVMKYSAKPCQSSLNLPTPLQLIDKDYLRKAMKEKLAAGSACFEFLVQTRDPQAVGIAGLSTEKSTSEWRESDTPPVKVATITIPKQAFDFEAQNKFCENLAMTPWHAVPEHRPLGGVNRIRRVVYKEVSALRRGLNGVTATEPTGNETF